MQTFSTRSRAFRRSKRVARLALALLLVLNPLLAVIPSAVAAEADPGGQSTSAMPCHTAAAHAPDVALPERQAQCPHCSDHAPPFSCHCCGQAAPAGLLTASLALRRSCGALWQRPVAQVDALPMPHRETLYRPPRHV